jgi:hypothetical protein
MGQISPAISGLLPLKTRGNRRCCEAQRQQGQQCAGREPNFARTCGFPFSAGHELRLLFLLLPAAARTRSPSGWILQPRKTGGRRPRARICSRLCRLFPFISHEMNISELENSSGVKPVEMTNLTAGEKVLKEQSIAMDLITDLPESSGSDQLWVIIDR